MIIQCSQLFFPLNLNTLALSYSFLANGLSPLISVGSGTGAILSQVIGQPLTVSASSSLAVGSLLLFLLLMVEQDIRIVM